MLQPLLGAGDRLLVDVSPYETIWGIGLDAFHPDVVDPSMWRGQNLLGQVLRKAHVCFEIPHPSLPTLSTPHQLPWPPAPNYQVNPDIQQHLPTTPTTKPATAPADVRWPADVPGDDNDQGLTVSASYLYSHQHHRFLPKHGQCLVDGTVKVDDASQTSKVGILSGFATADHAYTVFMDSESLVTFINSNTSGKCKQRAPLQRRASLRSTISPGVVSATGAQHV